MGNSAPERAGAAAVDAAAAAAAAAATAAATVTAPIALDGSGHVDTAFAPLSPRRPSAGGSAGSVPLAPADAPDGAQRRPPPHPAPPAPTADKRPAAAIARSPSRRSLKRARTNHARGVNAAQSCTGASGAAPGTTAIHHAYANGSAAAAAAASDDSVSDVDGGCSAGVTRTVVRDRGTGVKVPKSPDRWVVVGVFVASRDFPALPFWLPLVEPGTSRLLDLAVPYKSMMATLSPKYNDRDKILLHVRVAQRVDRCGLRLTGEERYLCTDIGVSYRMGDNAFKWISFHPTIFQVCCSTWNSSLNRAELEQHLALANEKGGMVFQAPEAEPARVFLRTILDGKALLATCSLRKPPNPLPAHVAIDAASAAAVAATGAGASAAAAAALGVDATVAEFAAALPTSALSLQTLPNAEALFASALRRVGRLWFHPLADTQDQAELQLTQSTPPTNHGADVSVAVLSSMLGAAAAQMPHDPVAAATAAATAAAVAVATASSMGMQRSDSTPVALFSAQPAPTLLGGVGPAPNAPPPPTYSAIMSLLANHRVRPFKSRSTKHREANERAPLQLDLLPFVRISSVLIEPADRTLADLVPSVVLCNLPREASAACSASDGMLALCSTVAVATTAAQTSALTPPQRKGSTGVRAKSAKPLRRPTPMHKDRADSEPAVAAGAIAAAAPVQRSLLLELLGAANSVKREPGTCAPDQADAATAAAAAAGDLALDALASVADPAPAGSASDCERKASSVAAIPERAIESKAAGPAAASSPQAVPAAGAAPVVRSAASFPSSPSVKVTIEMTTEELLEFQRFKAAQLAAATAAAAASASFSPWFLRAASSPQSRASLPITPRHGYLHSVTFGGSSLPITGVYSLSTKIASDGVCSASAGAH